MKDKILIFIIGLLVGAIITSCVFLVINKNSNLNTNGIPNGMPQMDFDGNFQTPPDKQNKMSQDGRTPPNMTENNNNLNTQENNSTNDANQTSNT